MNTEREKTEETIITAIIFAAICLAIWAIIFCSLIWPFMTEAHAETALQKRKHKITQSPKGAELFPAVQANTPIPAPLTLTIPPVTNRPAWLPVIQTNFSIPEINPVNPLVIRVNADIWLYGATNPAMTPITSVAVETNCSFNAFFYIWNPETNQWPQNFKIGLSNVVGVIQP